MMCCRNLVRVFGLSAAVGLMVLGGCPNFPGLPGNQGRGTLRVEITDKPFPFEFIREALVTITRVEVHRVSSANGNSANDNSDNDNDGGSNENENTSDNSNDNAGGNENENGGNENQNSNENENQNENGNENGNANQNENSNANDNGDDGNLNDNGGSNENANENENDNGDDGNENENGDDDGNENDNGDDDDGGSGWVVISSEEQTFDLLDLRDGRTDLLAEADIAAGTYNQMRLVVTGGRITLTDGREFDLRVPSGEQSGIKLHFTFELQDGEDTVLLLDVDLSRAFSAIPSGKIDDVDTIRNFRFHPSFGMRLIEVLEAGKIAGVVVDEDGNPLPDVSVTAFDDEGEEVTSTATGDDGSFLVNGLPTGTYRVEFSTAGFLDEDLDTVDVEAGETTDVGEVEMRAEG